MSVTIPSLSDVTDILDTDMVMVTQSGGQTYKISGADLNKRNQAVIANSTTLTGAPLKTGNIVRVHFTADITGVNTTTALSLSYNGTSKTVKVPKNGALVNFTAQNMGGSPTVYKYLQAYTTLELLYDGTNFVIIGNPVVISSSDYTIYADGYTKMNCRQVQYIQQTAIDSFYDYFQGRPQYSSFDYSSQASVEFRVLGYKHSNYGSAIAISRGRLLGLFIASDGTVTQYYLDNFSYGRA